MPDADTNSAAPSATDPGAAPTPTPASVPDESFLAKAEDEAKALLAEAETAVEDFVETEISAIEAAIGPIIKAAVATAATDLSNSAANPQTFGALASQVFSDAAAQIEQAGIQATGQTILKVLNDEIQTQAQPTVPQVAPVAAPVGAGTE